MTSPSVSGLLAALPDPPAGQVGWPWTKATPTNHYADAPPRGWPKISVVCPSFRQGRFIEETIRSVLLQNYPALEFIVVDGGSDDETVGILQKYSPWLTHWESTPDRGQAHALNMGFARATGELYGWINSDDCYLPDAFAVVGRAADPRARQIVYGNHEHFDDASRHREPVRLPDVFAFEIYAGGFTLPSHATFWTTPAHRPLDESLQFILDADLFKRIAAKGARIKHVDATLGRFRRHDAAKTALLQERGASETRAWLARYPRRHWWLLWRLHQLLQRLRGPRFSP